MADWYVEPGSTTSAGVSGYQKHTTGLLREVAGTRVTMCRKGECFEAQRIHQK